MSSLVVFDSMSFLWGFISDLDMLSLLIFPIILFSKYSQLLCRGEKTTQDSNFAGQLAEPGAATPPFKLFTWF